jgi:hypothetical protein
VSGCGVQFDAVGFQDVCGDRQAETGATTVVRTAWIGAGEPVEHAGGVVGGDPGTLVVDLQHTQLPGGQVVLAATGLARQRPARAECVEDCFDLAGVALAAALRAILRVSAPGNACHPSAMSR